MKVMNPPYFFFEQLACAPFGTRDTATLIGPSSHHAYGVHAVFKQRYPFCERVDASRQIAAAGFLETMITTTTLAAARLLAVRAQLSD